MAYWAVARLEWRRDSFGVDSLWRAGFEPYYPRLRETRVRAGRKAAITVPLFAGYVFITIQMQWHAARWAPGVIGLIMDGEKPGRVPDGVIADLRARERHGVVVLPEQPRLRPGDPVRVTRGPLAGVAGLYSRASASGNISVGLLQPDVSIC
jgi:transcription antitermination factor NusG